MTPKISIIVPVHNAGVYLRTCLDALRAQTMADIEIILVVDCPTDGSDSVCKQYAESDSRFVVITNPTNQHIGKCRNIGLAHAHGEYIAFVDHDDYMAPDMYERLYQAASIHDADLVVSSTTTVEDGKIAIRDIAPQEGCDIREYILQDLISSGGMYHNVSTFTYIHPNLFRHSMIREHAIQFVDTTKQTPEDALFSIEYLYHAHNVILLPESLYFHRLHSASTGHQLGYIDWQKRYSGTLYLYDWLQSQSAYERYHTSFRLWAQKRIMDGLLSILHNRMGMRTFRSAYRMACSFPFTHDTFIHYSDHQQRPFAKKIFRRILGLSLALNTSFTGHTKE